MLPPAGVSNLLSDVNMPPLNNSNSPAAVDAPDLSQLAGPQGLPNHVPSHRTTPCRRRQISASGVSRLTFDAVRSFLIALNYDDSIPFHLTPGVFDNVDTIVGCSPNGIVLYYFVPVPSNGRSVYFGMVDISNHTFTPTVVVRSNYAPVPQPLAVIDLLYDALEYYDPLHYTPDNMVDLPAWARCPPPELCLAQLELTCSLNIYPIVASGHYNNDVMDLDIADVSLLVDLTTTNRLPPRRPEYLIAFTRVYNHVTVMNYVTLDPMALYRLRFIRDRLLAMHERLLYSHTFDPLYGRYSGRFDLSILPIPFAVPPFLHTFFVTCVPDGLVPYSYGLAFGDHVVAVASHVFFNCDLFSVGVTVPTRLLYPRRICRGLVAGSLQRYRAMIMPMHYITLQVPVLAVCVVHFCSEFQVYGPALVRIHSDHTFVATFDLPRLSVGAVVLDYNSGRIIGLVRSHYTAQLVDIVPLSVVLAVL